MKVSGCEISKENAEKVYRNLIAMKDPRGGRLGDLDMRLDGYDKPWWIEFEHSASVKRIHGYGARWIGAFREAFKRERLIWNEEMDCLIPDHVVFFGFAVPIEMAIDIVDSIDMINTNSALDECLADLGFERGNKYSTDPAHPGWDCNTYSWFMALKEEVEKITFPTKPVEPPESLADFKHRVRSKLMEVKEEFNLCHSGVNDALIALGLPNLSYDCTETVEEFTARVRLVAEKAINVGDVSREIINDALGALGIEPIKHEYKARYFVEVTKSEGEQMADRISSVLGNAGIRVEGVQLDPGPF